MKNNGHSIIIIIFLVIILFFQFPAYANNVTNSNATINSENVYKPTSRERFIFYSENGQKYFDRDFYEIASQFFKRALIIKPDDFKMLVNLGLANMAIGHFSLASTHFEHALEIQPNNEKVDNYRRDALWLIKVQKGEIPDLEHELPIQATTAKGIELYYDGQFEKSLEMMERSLQNIPYELKALIIGGHALVELERYEEAMAYYDRALNINPRDDGVIYSQRTAAELLLKETGGVLYDNSLNEEKRKRAELEIKKNELKQKQAELKKQIDSKRKMYDYLSENKIEDQLSIKDLKNIQQSEPSIKSINSADNLKTAIKIVDKGINKTIDQINAYELDERLDSAIEEIPDRAVTAIKKTAICAEEFCFLDESIDQNKSFLNYTIQTNPQISNSTNYYIPQNTKNIGKIWLVDSITDTEFLTSTTYFIREQGKTRMISFEILKSSQNIDEFLIPAWLKNNVSWWINGYISDQEFINGLEYLIDVKIIKLLLIKTKLVGI